MIYMHGEAWSSIFRCKGKKKLNHKPYHKFQHVFSCDGNDAYYGNIFSLAQSMWCPLRGQHPILTILFTRSVSHSNPPIYKTISCDHPLISYKTYIFVIQ